MIALIVLGTNDCSDRQRKAEEARQGRTLIEAHGSTTDTLAGGASRTPDKRSQVASLAKLQQSCDAGDFQACLDLAQRFWQNKDTHWSRNSRAESAFERAIALNPEKTVAFQQQACGEGDAVACAMLGIIYEAGVWVKKDDAKSLEYSVKACDLADVLACGTACWKGDVGACLRMASLRWRGRGDEWECRISGDEACAQAFKVDRQSALELVQKNCGDGDLLACRCLAYAHVSPHVDLKGARLDSSRVVKMFGEACDQAQAESCYVMGRYYAEARPQTPRSITRAFHAFERACELGHAKGCLHAAFHFKQGKGVAQDKGKAVELERKACDLGERSACLNVKYNQEAAARAAPGALAASLDACEKGDMDACVSAGKTYAERKGAASDAAEAQRLFEKACLGGNGVVCRDLGFKFSKGIRVERNLMKGASFFKKACDLGDSWGCTELGMMYIKGLGVSQNKEKGLELIKRGDALKHDANPAQP